MDKHRGASRRIKVLRLGIRLRNIVSDENFIAIAALA